MPSTFSQSLRIELIGSGEQSGVWGVTTNNNLGSLIEQAISGNTSLDVTLGDITLTALNGVVDQSRSAVLTVSGTPGTTRVLTIPNVTKLYTVRNNSNAAVQIKTATGAAYSVPTAAQAYIFCDGSNNITGRTITDGAATILANPAPFNNTALTGVPTAPTAAQGTNTTQLATTAFVNAEIAADTANLAPINSPTFTGTPSAPTAAVGTNTTQLATTAFVNAEIANDAPTKTGGGASGTWSINISGNAATASNATTQAVTSNDTSIATTAFVRSIVPAGVILMWSGSIASIPSGWALCNGTGGTPDLRDRFVIGAGGSYAVGVTGGAATTTLSTANLPSHTHTGTTASTSIAHTHGFSATTGAAGTHSHTGSGTTSSTNVDHTHSGTTGNQSADHSHSGTTASENQNHSHSGTTDGVGNHSHGLINGTALYRVNAGGSWFTGSSGSLSYGEFGNTNDAGAHAHGFTTGGISNNHQHAFSTGGVSANHTHNVTTGGMSANAAHTHTYSFTTSTEANHTHTVSGTSASTDPAHTHTFTTDATGSGTAFSILPPYYALAYIMKT